MQNIKQQLGALTRNVAKLNVKSRSRRVASQPAVQIVTSNNGRKRGRRNANRSNNKSGPSITISRNELLTVVKTDTTGKAVSSLQIEPANFSYLRNIATSFENIKYNKIHIYYRPAVGTTVDGLITYGVDYGFKDVAGKDRKFVSAFTPSKTQAIWCDSGDKPLTVPTRMLHGRNQYVLAAKESDLTFGSLVYAVDGPVSKNCGEIWIDYTVTLSGTSPS